MAPNTVPPVETTLRLLDEKLPLLRTRTLVERKFGDAVRSKTDVAMMNEALCKVLCHNLVVLIHEMHELGIEPAFWAENGGAS